MNKDNIETGVIVVMAIGLLLGALLLLKDASAQENCYDKEALAVSLTYRLRRAPACRTFRCFFKRAPKNYKGLTVFKARNRSRVTWGTLGWAKSVAVVSSRKQIPTALLLSSGVEPSRLKGHAEKGFTVEELIAGDLKEHAQFVAEIQCLRARGEKLTSFREIVEVP